MYTSPAPGFFSTVSNQCTLFPQSLYWTSLLLSSLFDGSLRLRTTSKWKEGLEKKLWPPLCFAPEVSVSAVYPWRGAIYYLIELTFTYNKAKAPTCRHTSTQFHCPFGISGSIADSCLCLFDSCVNYLVSSEVVLQDQVDSYVSGQVCSIIHSVPCLLHVVLINSLGAGALMACAEVVGREFESNTDEVFSLLFQLWFFGQIVLWRKWK